MHNALSVIVLNKEKMRCAELVRRKGVLKNTCRRKYFDETKFKYTYL